MLSTIQGQVTYTRIIWQVWRVEKYHVKFACYVLEKVAMPHSQIFGTLASLVDVSHRVRIDINCQHVFSVFRSFQRNYPTSSPHVQHVSTGVFRHLL